MPYDEKIWENNVMRDYKFRGKSLRTGKWLYGSLYWDGAEYYILPNIPLGASDYEDYIVDQNTIGQYTGLKDKHGDDIWEGDIVRNKFDGIGVVVLYNGCWSIKWCEDEIYFLFAELEDYIEVIGNVIDNKYLLNNKQ